MTRTTVADSVGPLGARPASARPGGPVQASAMTTAMATAMATARLTCGRVPIRPHLHACRSWSHLPGHDVQGTGYSSADRDDDGSISAPFDAAMCISGAGRRRHAG